MPSIVDPSMQMGGAWTVTRGLLQILKDRPLNADVEIVSLRHRTGAAHRVRQLAAVAKSLISGLPAKVEFSRDRRILAAFNALRPATNDIAMLNGGDLAWLLPHLPAKMKRVLIAHNIEHQLLASQVRRRLDSTGLSGSFLRRAERRHREFEIEALHAAGNVIFLSSLDEQYAREKCPGLRTMVLPPLFAERPAGRPPRSSAGGTINMGMLANFEWWPNREGLDWFLTRVFPHVSARLRLHLFGAGSSRVGLDHARIVPHGFVASLDTVWSTCDFMLCPVISGGGVCVKVAEALYHGVPLVGSHFAARGLPLDADPSIVLLDSPEDWVAFLNSGADALAERTVPRSIGDRFQGTTYAPALASYLAAVMES